MRRHALLLAARALRARQSTHASTRPSSLAPFSSATDAPSSPSTDDRLRRDLNRLLYRARQRGVLELDIIVGRWADENVGTLDARGRDELARVLSVETPDLLNALLGRGPPPPGLEGNAAYAALEASVRVRLAGRGARTAEGAAWVSAWHDLKEGGNQ